jgi:hypothetical protein
LRAEAAAKVIQAGGRLSKLTLDEPSLETVYRNYFQGVQGVSHAA